MTTKTVKDVFRETTGSYKGQGLPKPIVVGLCRGDVLTFRFAGQRKENAVEIPIDMAFEHALAASSPEEFAPLERPVKFRSSASYKNGSKMTPLNVTIYPDDIVTIRQNGSAASTNLGSVWTRCLMTEAKIEMPKARKK